MLRRGPHAPSIQLFSLVNPVSALVTITPAFPPQQDVDAVKPIACGVGNLFHALPQSAIAARIVQVTMDQPMRKYSGAGGGDEGEFIVLSWQGTMLYYVACGEILFALCPETWSWLSGIDLAQQAHNEHGVLKNSGLRRSRPAPQSFAATNEYHSDENNGSGISLR